MFVVDTNVLVYAADDEAPEQPRCRELLEQWRRQPAPWYLTWAIVYEFLRVVTHARVLTQPRTAAEAWEFVAALLASPAVAVLAATRRHDSVLDEAVRTVPQLRGNLMHDAHTAVLMREHGIRRIVTRDTDFHRFGWLEVIDPLTDTP